MKYRTHKFGWEISDIENVEDLREANYFVFSNDVYDSSVLGFDTYEKAREYLDVIEKEHSFIGTYDHYLVKAVDRRTTTTEESEDE